MLTPIHPACPQSPSRLLSSSHPTRREPRDGTDVHALAAVAAWRQPRLLGPNRYSRARRPIRASGDCTNWYMAAFIPVGVRQGKRRGERMRRPPCGRRRVPAARAKLARQRGRRARAATRGSRCGRFGVAHWSGASARTARRRREPGCVCAAGLRRETEPGRRLVRRSEPSTGQRSTAHARRLSRSAPPRDHPDRSARRRGALHLTPLQRNEYFACTYATHCPIGNADIHRRHRSTERP